MMNREQTAEKLKQKLDHWNAELDTLEKRAEKFEERRRREAREAIGELRRQRDETAAAFDKLKDASSDAADDLRKGAQAAWDKMAQSIDRARQRYN